MKRWHSWLIYCCRPLCSLHKRNLRRNPNSFCAIIFNSLEMLIDSCTWHNQISGALTLIQFNNLFEYFFIQSGSSSKLRLVKYVTVAILKSFRSRVWIFTASVYTAHMFWKSSIALLQHFRASYTKLYKIIVIII